jgi:peptidoglycan-N-acetylglucosamine deacetylase
MRTIYYLGLFVLACKCYGQMREIAITIDDLPLVASSMNTPANQQRSSERFAKIVQALTENKVPATGFVIAGAILKGQWEFLEQFRKAGFMLGNHTYSHYNLNQMNANKYIADIDRADKILAPLLTEPKYFRYPFLAEGYKATKAKVLDYLAQNHYTIAPVTIDSKDFRFNQELYRVPYRFRETYVQKIKLRYLAYIWKATLKAEQSTNGQPVRQILLIHANLLNSYLLPEIIQMYKQNGYKFITLTEALQNPAPAIISSASEKENDVDIDDDFFAIFANVAPTNKDKEVNDNIEDAFFTIFAGASPSNLQEDQVKETEENIADDFFAIFDNLSASNRKNEGQVQEAEENTEDDFLAIFENTSPANLKEGEETEKNIEDDFLTIFDNVSPAIKNEDQEIEDDFIV